MFYRAATQVAKPVATLKHGFSMKIPINAAAVDKGVENDGAANKESTPELNTKPDMKEVAVVVHNSDHNCVMVAIVDYYRAQKN